VVLTGQDNDNPDFRREVVALLPRLRRFCRTLAGDGSGDDLLQATVEKALARQAQWQPGTRLDSWMYRIAQNLRVDLARHDRVRGTKVDVDEAAYLSGDDGRSIVESRSDLSAAERAMMALPEEQRAVLALIVLEERSYRDTAELLEIPIGTVMSRLARARRALDIALNGAQS
jgi:RNA polymerase sigma-70 factor (ECF subfamily)